jgi:hypothetical protein
MLVVAVFGAALLAIPHTGARTNAAASHSTNLGVAAHSSPSAATAHVAILTTFSNYTILPTTMELQITVTGASITHNTSLWVTVSDGLSGVFCTVGSLNLTLKHGSGGEFYNLSLDPVSMGGVAFTNCPFIQADPVIFNATVYTLNKTIHNAPVNATGYATAETSLIYAPLNVELLAPTGAVGAGNVTLVAGYTDQYVRGVQISIHSPSGILVLTTSLQWTLPTEPAIITWLESTPGVYPYALTVSTAYGNFTTNGNLTLLAPGGGTVYSNSSTWQNTSIFPGLSGAASGTILLVVGLIAGMIVALVVGRSLMRPSAVAPAQQWQPGATPAANTCSVCGKSFATPEELKDHAKSEHGMT